MTGGSMRPGESVRPGGAHWCEQHGRWECTKTSKRSKSRCHGPAIIGADCCRMHPGKKVAQVKAEGQVRMLAHAWDVQGDGIPTMSTADVTQRLLYMSWCRLHLLSHRLREQVEAEDGAGMVGTTYAAGRDGARVETGEAVRALMRAEGEERDRCARLAKQAHDMGIDERQIELQQGQAELVVSAFLAALAAIPGLLPTQRTDALTAFLGGLGRGGDIVPGQVASS